MFGSSGSSSMELLFFDTFSHSANDDSNLDLVQFPKPVCIDEIRIIPLGARVQADFPGGHPRLGATNPSAFQLEFFVNDLSRRNASTFVHLGEMNYKQNDEIQMIPEKVPTDGLLIKGAYTTITLAVYGSITKLSDSQESTPPQVQHKSESSNHGHQPVVVPLEWQAPDQPPPIDVRQHRHTHHPSSPPDSQGGSGALPPEPAAPPEPIALKSDNDVTETSSPRDGKDGDEARFTPPSAKKRKRPRTPPAPVPIPSECSSAPPSPPPPRLSRHDRSRSRSSERGERRGRQIDRDRSLERELSRDNDRSRERESRRERREARSRERRTRDKSDDYRERKRSISQMERAKERERERERRKRSCSPQSKDEFSDDLEEISSEDEQFDPNTTGRDTMSPVKLWEGADMIVGLSEQLDEECAPANYIGFHRHLPPTLDVHKVVECLKQNQDVKKNSEKFVIAMEEIAALFVAHSEFEMIHPEMQEMLIDWCRDGLDFDLALSQSQPAFKVRHLKAGMKLISGIMSSCSEEIMNHLLQIDIAGGAFLKLYLAPHMSLPFKLNLIRCLDLLSHFKCGLSYLMYHRIDLNFPTGRELVTCYQALVKILLAKPSSRLSVALSALLSKLHLCDLCATLKNVAVDLMNSEPGMEPSLDEASTILKQISEMHLEAATSMGQYVRSLPARAKFDHPIPVQDPYISLYTIYRYNDFLITCCVLSSRSRAFLATFESLLNQLMTTLPGCVYLLENSHLEGLLEQLLPRLAPQLRAVSLINTVFEETSEEAVEEFMGDVDRNQLLVGALHRIAALTVEKKRYGVEGCTRAISLEDNIECLLQFLSKKPSGEPQLKAPICAGYAVMLLKTVVQQCSSVSFFEKNTTKLLEVAESSSRLESILPWLEPLTKLNTPYDHTCIAPLVANIKSCLSENALLCPQVVSCLRVLKGICSTEETLHPENVSPLKTRFNLAELFSQDGLSILCQVVEKLCEHYSAPLAVKLELSSRTKVMRLLQVLSPSIHLVSEMIKQVIACRGSDFKDLSPIPILLTAYQLCWMLGEESLCQLVIHTLLAYTQPLTDGTESIQALNKSLWTVMLKKVLGNLRTGPRAFGISLQVLCEILPLPFPLKVERPIESEADVKTLITNRKLWSVHLDQCRTELAELYQTLSTSTDLNVVKLLELLTCQIADLSSPSCQLILDILSEHICTFPSANQEQIQGPINLLSQLAAKQIPVAAGCLLLYANTEAVNSPLTTAVNLIKDSTLEGPVIASVHFIKNVLSSAAKYASKETISNLVKSLLEHTGSEKAQPITILECVRSLNGMREAKINHVSDVLNGNVKLIYTGMRQLSVKFASHCQDSLSGLLSFLDLVKNLENNKIKELVLIDSEDGGSHPIVRLKEKLKDESCEGLETSYNELQSLWDENQEEKPVKLEISEDLPSDSNCSIDASVVYTLPEIFEASREICVLEAIDEFELEPPEILKVTRSFDEYNEVCSAQRDTFLIETDLVAISEMCTMSELSLRAELEKMLRQIIKQEPLQMLPKHHRTHSVSEEAKKPFVAPMRASVNAMPRSQSTRANDPFRSRPPNTSRPPSMHVDDFVAMETSSAPPPPPGPHHRSGPPMHRVHMERPMRAHMEGRPHLPSRGHPRAPWGNPRYF